MNHGSFGSCTIGARHSRASRHYALKIVFLIFANQAIMRATIEQAFQAGINVSLQGTAQ